MKILRRDVSIEWTISGYLPEIKLPEMDTKRFSRLTKVARVVFTIPHSNAGEERVFSMIRKRDDQGRMNLQGTLSSLLTAKMNLPETKANPCYSFEPPQDLLKRLRRQLRFTIRKYALQLHL